MYETNPEFRSQTQQMTKEEAHSSKFLSKVYGYMFFAILLTALIALGVSFGINYGLGAALNGEDTEVANQVLTGILVGIVISSVGVLVCSITISIMSIRNRRSITVPAVLYTIFMGALVGLAIFPFTNGEDWWILASAFGITAMTFGIMYIIGATTKRNLNWLGTLGLGLLFGALILGLVFCIIAFFMNNMALAIMTTAVNGIVFVAFLLITMWDVWRIQKIAERGYESKNLALYCAFTLYVDFIYIFLRILSFIARYAKKR